MRRACLASLLLPLLAACEGELSVPVMVPVADAGFDQVRHLSAAGGVEVTLDGRASCDPVGDGITAASWTLVSAPSPDAELTVSDDLQASFVASEPGEYLLTLVVTAGGRVSEPDFLVVRVMPGDGDDVTVEPPVTDACGQLIDGA